MQRYISLCLALLVILIGGCDSGPRIAPLDDDAVILAFGDSLTYGTGASHGQPYPDVLSALLDRTVINAGIPGEISAEGLKRLPRELAKHRPALVILCHGGNDFLRRLNQDTTIRNIKSMVDLIKAQGADIVLVGVPKLGFGLDVPEFYATIAEESEIPYEKDILVDLLGDSSMKSDTIHPNDHGYLLMAEAIYRIIEEAQ